MRGIPRGAAFPVPTVPLAAISRAPHPISAIGKNGHRADTPACRFLTLAV